MSLHDLLLALRKRPRLGKMGYLALKLLGVEIPTGVRIGKNLGLPHGGVGVVVHCLTIIEDDVRIYPGVTIGRADVYKPAEASNFRGVRIASGAILGTGSKILCDDGILCVGRDTVVGANAVLTQSTGDGEIWAGVPARRVGLVPEEYCTHRQS